MTLSFEENAGVCCASGSIYLSGQLEDDLQRCMQVPGAALSQYPQQQVRFQEPDTYPWAGVVLWAP